MIPGRDLPDACVPLDALRRDAPPPRPAVTPVDPDARALRVQLLAPRIARDYRDGHPVAAIRAGYDLNRGELYETLHACGVPLRHPALRSP